jgi:hypothetical protein
VRFIPGIGAFLATFAIAIAANAVFDYIYPRFDGVVVGSMVMPPGGRGGFSSFRSRGGVDLIFEHLDFPSHEAANEAFQNVLTGSKQIIEREVLYDREGKLVTGERVVITYRARSGVDAAAVITLDDTKLYEIASSSLRHTLFFERAHRRY